MRHPFERLSPRSNGAAAVLVSVLSLVVAALVLAVAEAGPGFRSISELVWAGTPARAAAVVSSWSDAQSAAVRWLAGLHGLFVALLFNALALAVCWAGRPSGSRLVRALGASLAWLAWLCVVTEIPEAVAMHRLVRGSVEAPWPQIAAASTWLHHVVLYTGLLYTILGLGARVVLRSGGRRPRPRAA